MRQVANADHHVTHVRTDHQVNGHLLQFRLRLRLGKNRRGIFRDGVRTSFCFSPHFFRNIGENRGVQLNLTMPFGFFVAFFWMSPSNMESSCDLTKNGIEP